MKNRSAIILFGLILARAGFAENLTLDNETGYPTKKAKISVQWVTTAQEVSDGNHAATHGLDLNQGTIQSIIQAGKVSLSIPKNATYFRVLLWSKGNGTPDYLTNWVEAIPNKTYTLTTEHLVPTVLMIGMGC